MVGRGMITCSVDLQAETSSPTVAASHEIARGVGYHVSLGSVDDAFYKFSALLLERIWGAGSFPGKTIGLSVQAIHALTWVPTE